MGCGRVGSELLAPVGSRWSRRHRHRQEPNGVLQVSAGRAVRQVVGLGFDRDVLEDAGIKEADAFIAVSSGDNSNIVSARVALEHYHVPKVIARIYDPRRAEIYERLNIPTVATTTWGVKQIQLMLLHDREEVRESLGGGDLLRVGSRSPAHLVGKPATLDQRAPARSWSPACLAGGGGFIPTAEHHAAGGRLPHRDRGTRTAMDLLDELLAPPSGARTDEGRRHGGGRGRAPPRRGPRRAWPRRHADRAGSRDWSRSSRVGGPGVHVMLGDALRAVGARGGATWPRPRSWWPRPGDDEDNLVTSLLAKQEFAVPARARPREPPEERVALHRAVGRGRGGLARRTSSPPWSRRP